MGRHAYLIAPVVLILASCTLFSAPPTDAALSTSGQTPVLGRGEIRGIVLDTTSGAPITAANVNTDPPTSSVTTGADGSYLITSTQPGSYTVTASKGGYIPASVDITVAADKTTTADLQLILDTTATLPPPIPAPTATAAPASTVEPIEVSVMCSVYGQSPVHIKQGTPIILTWRWTADRDNLVQEHMQAAIYQILLDGKDIQADRVSAIEYISEQDWFAVTWYTEPVILEAGEHLTERNLSWYYEISDGWNTYGPGGKYETLHDTCTIIVE